MKKPEEECCPSACQAIDDLYFEEAMLEHFELRMGTLRQRSKSWWVYPESWFTRATRNRLRKSVASHSLQRETAGIRLRSDGAMINYRQLVAEKYQEKSNQLADVKLALEQQVEELKEKLKKATDALQVTEQQAADCLNQTEILRGLSAKVTVIIQNRDIEVLCKFGLLTDAARLIDEQISNIKTTGNDTKWSETQITILKSELEVLQQELSIAQRRGYFENRGSHQEIDSNNLEEASFAWLEQLRTRATSQLGQDLWVLEKTSYKRGGFFVEFGATNGILLSNSYLLEKEFGWRGICAEPNKNFLDELKKNRRCTVSPACIGASTGEEVEFIFADVFGGMARDAACDEHEKTRTAYRDEGNFAILKTISLHDFLKSHNAPVSIDYLSIDTEGSEFSILEKFPFDQWDIHLITVEHNFTEQRARIRTLLESYGYQCEEAQWDDWYVKSR